MKLHALFTLRSAIVRSYWCSRETSTKLGGSAKLGQSIKLIRLLSEMDTSGAPRMIVAGRYDYGRVTSEIVAECKRQRIQLRKASVFVDISCLTAVQLVFLLNTLHYEERVASVTLLYTRPKFYASVGNDAKPLTRPTYRVIPIPIRRSSRPGLGEIRSIAILPIGHEGRRTFCAWRFADAQQNIVIFPMTGSHRLMDVCARENGLLLDLSKRDKESAIQYLDALSLAQAKEQVRSYISANSQSAVRASLIPFGPKPLVVGCLLGIVESAAVECELLYTVPGAYNALYSEGADGVFFEVLQN